VLWSWEHFHYYLYDRHSTIETDHKLLVTALSRMSSPKAHIQRWLLHLQAHEHTLEYIPGTEKFLSCSYLPLNAEEQVAETFFHTFVNDAVPKALPLEQLVTATKADKILFQVIKSISSSNWIKTPAKKPYFHIRNDLSVANGILFSKTLL